MIFTLREERSAEFDRLAEQAAEGVRLNEPDTLVYVFHTAPAEPMQRIIYEIYRNRAAFESHQRQPHIQRFMDGVKPCILGSNAIDLRLKYAKVAPIQGASQAGGGQPAASSSASRSADDFSAGGRAVDRRSSGGRADAEQTPRHRAPQREATSRSLGEEPRGDRLGEPATSAGGRRRAEAADEWTSDRDWGRA
jgi:quinol monooxygenase YgiN